MFNAKNGCLPMAGAEMDYIVFGRGQKHLIMIPGLGDGLVTVRGKALPFAMLYRMYAKDYRIWVFSRKSPLPQGHSTRDMADDLSDAMAMLGIHKAHIIGISQGGMIAQWMAVDHPQQVEKLVLAVTAPCSNPMMEQNIRRWMDMACRQDYGALMADNLENMYTEAYVRKSRWLQPITTRIGKPKSFERFLIQAEACLTHHTPEVLEKITAPTLILGGGADRTLGIEGSHLLAERIPNSRLHIWPDYGHAVYEEAADFHAVVMDFLKG